MSDYDPTPAIARIPDQSSLVAQVLNFLYSKPKAPKCSTQGAKISYRVEGRGQNLLLISPLGADGSFWARNVPKLAEHFRVITFDNRGSGSSEGRLEGLSTWEMARDALGLLDHLGVEKVHVAGLALGALIGQQLARICPERINSLILASAYSNADNHLAGLTADWREVALRNGMEPLFDKCLEWLFSPEYTLRGSDINQLKTFFRLTLQQAPAFVAQSLAGIEHDSRQWLSELRMPVLILQGAADRLVRPELAHALSESLPNARLVMLESAPHFLHWECADRFNDEILEFCPGLTMKEEVA
jgi:pimeloyl-ACP methyl ester carboxylesterase